MFTNQLSDNWARKKCRYQIARHSLATNAGLIPKWQFGDERGLDT